MAPAAARRAHLVQRNHFQGLQGNPDACNPGRGSACDVSTNRAGGDARLVYALSVQPTAAMSPRTGGAPGGTPPGPFFPPISLGRNGGARRAGASPRGRDPRKTAGRRVRDAAPYSSRRKKALSSQFTGRKRPAFVVPPMFRAELRSLCPSVAGREPRPSPGPLVGPSPAPLPRTLSADGVLSVAVDVAVLAPSGRFCLTIVSQTGKKVNPYSSQAGEKSTSPELPLFCWRVTTGFGSVSSSPPAVVRTARNSRS